MNMPSDLTERKRRLAFMLSSPENQQSCQQFQKEFERLVRFAASQQLTVLKNLRETETVRREFASQSDLHRGYYCPSPVYDLIVGNTHRGKLLNRITSRSKPSHAYGFDDNKQLLWCDFINNGNVSMSEYLVYRDHVIYGITFDSTGHIRLVTEEVYQNSTFIQYTRCLCPTLNGTPQCVELLREEYTYDEAGIRSSTWYKYIHASDLPTVFKSTEFSFQREDGYIVSYRSGSTTYYPRIRRSAINSVNKII